MKRTLSEAVAAFVPIRSPPQHTLQAPRTSRPFPKPFLYHTLTTSAPSFRLNNFSPSATALLAEPASVASVVVVTRFGFLQFLAAFILGGLFFSTVLAGVATFIAVGSENMNRLFGILGVVTKRVWEVFCLGVSETCAALRLDGKWKWRDAWRVLKLKLLETRNVVSEGVEAIRTEAKLYSAVVGAPGLIPVQYAIDRLLPFSIQTQMRQAMKDVLSEMDNPNVKKAILVDFNVGTKTPQLLAARVYDLGSEAMAFDVEVKWESDLEAKINVYAKHLGVKIPVTVRNVCFDGPVRVTLVPLMNEPPGFGAALISLPSSPKIGLDVRVAGGEVLRVPWLKKDILKGIQQSLEDTFLWPKRIVLPQELAIGTKKLLTAKQLEVLESTDPLLKAELAMMEKPMLREHCDIMKRDREVLPDQLQIDVIDKEEKTAEPPGVVTVGNVSNAELIKAVPSRDNGTKQPKSLFEHWRSKASTARPS